MNNTRKTALVTGASSGIGVELARVLAADGHDLVLVARREDRLRQLAEELTATHGVRVHVIVADLAVAGAANSVVQQLDEQQRSVDVLVNNAGFGVYGPVAETPPEELLGMIQVNVVALTHLTRLLLPGMLARRSGQILNVASTAAFQPGPLMAVYFASKAFVLSFSEALANELAGTGVTVTALCPGPIQSGFQERARMGQSKLVFGKKLPGPEWVAKAALRALKNGRRVIIPGISNKLFVLAAKLAPRRLVIWVTSRLLERVRSSGGQ